MATFRGFSDRAVGFYSALGADNSKTFWAEHKAVYEDEVREPMRNLLAELESEFGAGTVFRPHRDTRFSKDKAPYKTHQGAVAGSSAGIGFYVQLDSRGLLVGGGFRAHSTAQVERYRKAVDYDDTGAALGAVVAAVRDNGFAIEGDQLKTKPKGYDANHPRLDLLRYKSLMATKTFGRSSWLASPRTLEEVRESWRTLIPLNDWITANVGPA